jgi:hypothetical protein
VSIRKLRATVLSIATVTAITASIGAPGAQAKFRDRDCADFSSQAQAQRFYVRHGGPEKDRHGLDADHDGLACEDLP